MDTTWFLMVQLYPKWLLQVQYFDFPRGKSIFVCNDMINRLFSRQGVWSQSSLKNITAVEQGSVQSSLTKHLPLKVLV